MSTIFRRPLDQGGAEEEDEELQQPTPTPTPPQSTTVSQTQTTEGGGEDDGSGEHTGEPFGPQPERAPGPPGQGPPPAPSPLPQPAPAPPTTTTAPSTTGDGTEAFSGTFNQQSFLSFISTQPPTAATLDTFWNQNRAALEQQGWGYIPHPRDPKFVTPDGRFHIDVIQGGGGPNPRWQWLQEPANTGGIPHGGGGGSNALPTGGFGTTAPPPVTSAPLVTDLGPDPFGPLIEGILGDLAANQGMTDFGSDISDALLGIIESGGAAPNDTTDLQFERAREGLARAQRTSQNALRDALASRNLLSVSGIDQGPEVSSIGRVQQRLGEDFHGAVRDIFIEQSRQDDNRLTNALSLATGLASDQARSLLSVAQAAGREREVLSNIALGVLDRNMSWNMFLAQHGLDRVRVMAEIQQGNFALALALGQAFINGAGTAAGGFV